jgi:hypothetical protein
MANPVKLLFTLCCLLLLTACATQESLPTWPAELPARSEFQQEWLTDSSNRSMQSQAEYLLWVQRFYQGFNMVPGWLGMMEQVEARLPPEQWPTIEPRLDLLGRHIGGEWAKHNDVRKLHTRTAAVWRDALLEALRQNDLDAFLLRLEQDVAAMLSGQLGNEDIRFERYYVDEFDF